jgi:hypothetical protein
MLDIVHCLKYAYIDIDWRFESWLYSRLLVIDCHCACLVTGVPDYYSEGPELDPNLRE